MHGNVLEWCQDWSGPYAADALADPQGPAKGGGRVLRGGCWFIEGRSARSTCRVADDPGHRYDYAGLRLARGQAARW